MIANVLTAGMLSLELLHAGGPAADYPIGSFWPDEKTLPMESCVGEFSFEMQRLMLIPALPGQKTSILSISARDGNLLVRARRKAGCTYDCKMQATVDHTKPVVCSKVGSV